jgi:hypothetical protein
VNFDGPRELIGEFVEVVITEALPNSLRGRLVVEPRGRDQRVAPTGAHVGAPPVRRDGIVDTA